MLDALELERTRSLAAIGISLEPPPAAPELERPVHSAAPSPARSTAPGSTAPR